MALIHENLFKIDNLTIDPEAYFDMLIQNVNNAYQLKNIQTTVSINHSRIMDLDTAIPLGLILNELVTNSFKYAFEENRQNKLRTHQTEN